MQFDNNQQNQTLTTDDLEDINTLPKENRVLISLVGFFLILLIGIGGFFVWEKHTEERGLVNYESAFQQGGNSITDGNIEKSIIHFQQAFRMATTPSEEAQAKFNLGVAQLGTDPATGITTLKEVSTDDSYPDFYRAGAVNYILGTWYTVYDPDFARNMIFTGPTWETFLNSIQNDTEIHLAVRRAYEHGLDLFPTFLSEYRVASWYALHAGDTNINDEQRNIYTQNAQLHIQRGNEILEHVLSSRERYEFGVASRQEVGLAHMFKALALGSLFFNTENIVEEEDVRNEYREALIILDEASESDITSRNTGYFVRFNFATFLARLNDEEENVRKLLGPIITASERAPIYIFLASQGDEQKNNIPYGEYSSAPSPRESIINLAQMSPEFRNRLLEISAWQTSYFE